MMTIFSASSLCRCSRLEWIRNRNVLRICKWDPIHWEVINRTSVANNAVGLWLIQTTVRWPSHWTPARGLQYILPGWVTSGSQSVGAKTTCHTPNGQEIPDYRPVLKDIIHTTWYSLLSTLIWWMTESCIHQLLQVCPNNYYLLVIPNLFSERTSVLHWFSTLVSIVHLRKSQFVFASQWLIVGIEFIPRFLITRWMPLMRTLGDPVDMST